MKSKAKSWITYIKIHRMLYFAEVFLNGPQQIVKCWKAIMDFGKRDWIRSLDLIWVTPKCTLTVVLREIWNISEIEKMKNCSKVPFYMGKMNFWSKCAYVSWLLRYSVFSILTKISWRIFLPKLQKNWAWLNISESTCGFAFIRRFQKWYKFWKLIIQQLTYEQFAV